MSQLATYLFMHYCGGMYTVQDSLREISDKFDVAKSTVFHCRNRICSLLSQRSVDFIRCMAMDSRWAEANCYGVLQSCRFSR